MKDLRRSSFTYIECLLLHPAKHNLLFFSIWFFFHEYSQFIGQQLKGEAISFHPFNHFPLLYRHLDVIWVIAAESSPLRKAGSRNQT